MIREITVCPVAQNKRAYHIFFALLVAAAAIFGVSMAVERLRGVIQLCALLMLVPAILVYTRYIGVRYVYEIVTDTSGMARFVASQRIGKRASTLCDASLASLRTAVCETAAEARAHKTPVGVRRYVCTPSILPERSYRLHFRGRNENLEVRIEATADFIALLTDAAEQMRLLQAEESD